MADEKIKLIKEFLTNQDAKNTIDRSFSELISKKNRITINEFFDYYNNLFYDIPQLGALSHTELIDRSIEYLGDYEDPRDKEILNLNNEIDLLAQRINELELDQFENEFDDLTNTVLVTVLLKDGGWPNKFSRVKDLDRTTHRLIFDDYINDPIYKDYSYNYFQNGSFTFKTTSPTFQIWYSGFNDVKNNQDPVAWRTSNGGTYGAKVYSISEGEKTKTVNLTLTSAQAHNASYPPSWTPQ